MFARVIVKDVVHVVDYLRVEDGVDFDLEDPFQEALHFYAENRKIRIEIVQ